MVSESLNRVVRVDAFPDEGVEWRMQRESVYVPNDVPDVSVLFGRELRPSETGIVMYGTVMLSRVIAPSHLSDVKCGWDVEPFQIDAKTNGIHQAKSRRSSASACG